MYLYLTGIAILILGLGEERHEITDAMRDLYHAGCELLTITQYLRPPARHRPVERWVPPEEFAELRDEELSRIASWNRLVILPGY
jgi:lipoyl synthase